MEQNSARWTEMDEPQRQQESYGKERAVKTGRKVEASG